MLAAAIVSSSGLTVAVSCRVRLCNWYPKLHTKEPSCNQHELSKRIEDWCDRASMSLQRWLQLPLYVSTKRLSKKYFAVVFLYSDISLKRMRRLQRRIRCVVIFCTKTHHDYRLASLQAPEMGGRLFNKGNNWGENMTRTQYDHISEAAAAEWAGTLDEWTRRLMHTQFWQFEYLSLNVHMDTQKHLIWPGCWQAHTLNWAAQGPSRPPPGSLRPA